MKNNLFLMPLCVILLGCTTPVPVERNFPNVPLELLDRSEPLKRIPLDSQPSDVFKTVIENYGMYNDLRIKYDAWQTWYRTQKDIFDKVGK